MAIKNYRSESKNTFDKIQKVLATHRAKQVFFDYDDEGRVKALAFSIEMQGRLVGFRLPARVDKVAFIMYHRTFENLNIERQDQAYRTAWANIRDWLDAQMALIDTEQVKIEEVFLPYALNESGQTFFETIEQKGYLLPASNNG